MFETRRDGTVVADKNASIDSWRPVFFFLPKEGCVTINTLPRYMDGSVVEVLCDIRWRELSQSMPANNLELVRVLVNTLYAQTMVINTAVHLLSLDIDARQSRKITSKQSAAKRARPKTDRVKQEVERKIKAGRDPRQWVAQIARAAKCSTTLVYSVLNGKK